jgi:anti-sigma factor RsiW
MSCKTIRDRIDLYAGGDLDGREAAQIAAHLKSCLGCYREFAEMHELLGRVRATARDGARGADGSESLVAGVMGEIHGPPPPAPALLPRLLFASGWAAALLLAASLGFRILTGGAQEPSAGGPPRRLLQHESFDVLPAGGTAPASALEDDLGRDLEELRASSGPSRSPRARSAPPIRVPKNF